MKNRETVGTLIGGFGLLAFWLAVVVLIYSEFTAALILGLLGLILLLTAWLIFSNTSPASEVNSSPTYLEFDSKGEPDIHL
jgi:hypothetical protein